MQDKFKYYHIILANNKEKFTFTYEIFAHRPAQIWAAITSQVKATDLRPNLNLWRGINKNYQDLLSELKIVTDEINLWSDNKMEINSSMNMQAVLNKLHIHFPDSKAINDPEKKQQLTKFNDLIHELEQLYTNKIFQQEFFYILLCADNFAMYDLESKDYQYFDPTIKFGDLTLHYCHVGRHPYEVFIRNDKDCPKEHILPQTKISCFHTLRFFDNRFDSTKWKTFYTDSQIMWPYKIDDPRLALGYIKLGKLLYINGQQQSRNHINYIARSCHSVCDWMFEKNEYI